jgi:hypothetical protein
MRLNEYLFSRTDPFTFTVVWSYRAPTQAALNALKASVGEANFSKIVIKSGIGDLVTYLQTFF